MIDHHDANIFARHLADRLAIAIEDKLLIANGEMCRLTADFERAFDHNWPLRTDERDRTFRGRPLAMHPRCGVSV